ncbi:MAG: hypothetical protein V4617_10780 [Gemmatimonadota bacterium]
MISLLLLRAQTRNTFAGFVALLFLCVFLALPGMSVLLAPMLVMAQLMIAGARTDLFEAALPIRARDILIARMLPPLVCTAIPLCVLVFANAVKPDTVYSLWSVVGVGVAGLLVCVLPFAIGRSRLTAVDEKLQFAFLIPACGLVVLSAQFEPATLPAVLSIAALTIALVVALLRVWRTPYDGFVIVPTTPLGAQSRRSSLARRALPSATVHEAERVAPLWWAVVRYTLRSVSPFNWFWIAWMMYVDSPSSSPLLWVAILLIGKARDDRWLAALPLSHRARLLPQVVLFAIVCFTCFGVARSLSLPGLSAKELTHGAPRHERESDRFDDVTGVSLTFWERATSAETPVITAPWGESTRASSLRILGVAMYNPFTVDSHNSSRYVDWQFERATKSVFGRTITRAEYQAEGFEAPVMRSRTWRLGLLRSSIMLSLLLLVSLLARGRNGHHSRGEQLRRWIAGALVIWGALFVCVLELTHVIRRMTGVVMPLLDRQLLQLSDALPESGALLLLIVCLPPLCIYPLVERSYRRSEAVAQGLATSLMKLIS